jgi:hypothetical protein
MRVFSSISKLTWVFVFPLLFSCTSDEDDNTTTCIKTAQEATDSTETSASRVSIVKKDVLYFL